jgi:hypothetical protein
LALCSLENKDARARFGILKGLHSARRGREPRRTRTNCAAGQPPDRGTHGVSGHPPAHERPEHERRKDARTSRSSRRARLDNRALPHPGLRRAPKGHHRDRPERAAPSKRNSESSGRSRRDRSVNDGLRFPCSPQSSSHEKSKADIHLPVYESARVASVQLGSDRHDSFEKIFKGADSTP